MIIQAALIAALFCVFIYAASQRKRALAPSLIIAVVSLSGITLVMAPGAANDIAHAVGVGRGADLVTYCFIVLAIAAIFNVHLRLRAQYEKYTELVRAIAIMNATISADDQ